MCLLYIQYTHTLFPLTEVALQRPGVGWKERKKKKKTSESRKSLLTYFFSREREKVMKNMEGKRKSLPFMLRLIIEGRTSLWVYMAGREEEARI